MGFFDSFVFSSPISYLYSSGLYDINSFYSNDFEIIEEEIDSFDILNEIIYYETDLYTNNLNIKEEITNNLNTIKDLKESKKLKEICDNIIKYTTLDDKNSDMNRINKIFNNNKNCRRRKYRNNRNKNKFKK